jgi:uncharacterized protein YidB (DUF937 family)
MNMGLLDSMMSAAGQVAMGQMQGSPAAGGPPADLMALAGDLLQQAGGLSGVLEKFQSQGLGEAVQSWVGTGANLPISAQQLSQALGPDVLAGLANKFGGQAPELAQLASQWLPVLVDRLTPGGQLPADNGLGALANMGGMADLAGLAGQLLGRK